MKKIRILLIGMSSNIGGIETYIYNLVKCSDKNTFQFDFLSIEQDKLFAEDELKTYGCTFYRITPRNINYKKHVDEIKKIMVENDYDFIHYSVMSFSWCEPIIIANKYSNAQIIIHSHNAGFDSKTNMRTKFLHKMGEVRIRNIPYLKVACGKDAGKYMFGSNDFLIFNNGVNIDRFKYDEKNRAEIRKECKIGKNKIIVGLTARLERQKNVLFLLDIFNEILKLDTNMILVLTGEGSLRDEISKKIEEYNISNKVILLGKRTDAYKIYSAYDIFLMPSLYEGLSISLIEAQISGLKCYTSDSVDVKSNITGNVEFLSLKKSPREWAEYIIKQNNARDRDVVEKIPEEFNAQKSYEKVFDFYKKNINNK